MIMLYLKKKTIHLWHNSATVKGEVLEWLMRHAWKACIRLKRIAGSNPAFSAYLELKLINK